MTNKELHDKFQQMMNGQVQDVLNRFEEAMEKIDVMEKSFETKLDNKFNELLSFPQPPPAAPVAPLQQQQLRPLPNQYGRAHRVPIEPRQTSGAAATAVGASLLLLLLLLVPRRMMSMREIMRMRLIKIRTTCHHQHNNHQVVHMQIMAMVGLTLKYEIMTISLN